MTASTPLNAAAAPSTATTASARRPTTRLVTDAPTRMFHWLFALSFVGAYLTAEGERWRALHVTLGYLMAGLLVFRLVYGLVGPRQARWGVLWRKLAGAPAWMGSLRLSLTTGVWSTINWRQGQNLLMAAAIALLLMLALPLTLSGYASYSDWGDVWGGDGIAELHEWLGNAFLAVVLGHLALITGLSLLRRNNLAQPMLTGRVDGNGPDLVKANRLALAAALLIAVLAFGAWQWQLAPNGLLPSNGLSAGSLSGHPDDDD